MNCLFQVSDQIFQHVGFSQDKIKINSLSMVAEDHAESKQNAEAIYRVIREPLVSKRVTADRKLPLVYVIDSILKNVKGNYIAVIEEDAKTWLPIVYQSLSEEKQVKLKKVYNLWKDAGVFSEEKWKEMGASFTGSAGDVSGMASNPKLETAGMTWGVRRATLPCLVTFTMSLLILCFACSPSHRKMAVCC